MHPIDFGILVIYLIAMVYIGFFFEKKASTGIDAYFWGIARCPGGCWDRLVCRGILM
jgi:Na+/proline symporter